MDGTRIGLAVAGVMAWGCFSHPATVHAEVLDFIITVDGPQEDPPVETTASGFGTATLDTDTNLFSWNITFADLLGAQTAAHFHGPAPRCETAGVEITLPLGSPIAGMSVVTAQEADAIQAGLWYVNIHSNLHPGGEIRGQVLPDPLDDPVDPIAQSDVHVQLTPVVDGMTAPNWGTHAPGDDRLFVSDQPGTLWAVDLEAGSKSVFLDVSSMLVELGIFGPDSFDERGLLGVAFHPEYQKNGLLYTYTSEPADADPDFSTIPAGAEADHQTVIREWAVPEPANRKSVVDPASTRVLLRIDQPQFNHNAGAIDFGPDDRLYIALGDGGGADDQDGQQSLGTPMIGHGCIGNGQDTSNPLGSVLRIDPGGSNSANGEYGIPAENPFVGVDGLDEIFAYGFRNPFRVSFDPGGTGQLFAADVGQNDIEEVNIVVAGGNYGWNYREGAFDFVANGTGNGYVTDRPLAGPPDLLDPIAQYDHDDGIAIIGGFVYRGSLVQALSGRYLFGEFAVSFDNDGRLFHLDETNQILELQLVGQASFGRSLLGMGQDGNGEVYALANSTGVPFGETGVVLRIGLKPGDTNADGVTNVTDLVNVITDWGTDGSANGGDVNGDGTVDVLDLIAVINGWG